ncbi:MAG: pgeF [Pseudonocardia sp.]|jgi:YfiH family protein|nr:pgeF [Pseudonocardia sp.]
MTTRDGGHSVAPFDAFNLSAGVGDDPAAVTANREMLAGALGLGTNRVVWMQQVHGTGVAVVDEPADGDLTDTDAMVTNRPGLGLAVLVADCVPVLLADEQAGVIGVAHAGRRGAVAGVVPAAIKAMTDLGARPEALEVLLGPAICGGCYEVGGHVQAEVEQALPGSACRTRAGTPGVDLHQGLTEQLRALGVTSVAIDPRCTFEEPDLYSHRRDRSTGRFAAVTWLDDSA